jgi:hypothetical protein
MKFLAGMRAMGAAFALVMIGALVHAGVGSPPGTGFALIDGAWLNGLSGGTNYTYQSGITAHAGGGQTSAFQLPAGINMFEVDTVATGGDSIALPQCVAGTYLWLRNGTASTSMSVYGSPTVNSLTAANDTINGTAGSSAYTIGGATNGVFFCAKNGAWSAGKIS